MEGDSEMLEPPVSENFCEIAVYVMASMHLSLSLQMPQDSLTSETLRSSLLYQQPQSLIQPSLQAEMDCDISNPLQVGVLS